MSDRSGTKPPNLRKAFGQIIRTLREERGLDRADVSAATGLSVRAIGATERAEASPTLDTMEIFAVFYGVLLEELLKRARGLL